MGTVTEIFATEEQRANATKLREFIAQLSPRQCFMGHYLSQSPSNDPAIRGTHECNTSACLAGWGAAMLAPTWFVPSRLEDRASLSHAFVPKAWADQHGLMDIAWQPSLERASRIDLPEGYLTLEIFQVGAAVLGPGLARLFTAGASWPEETDMTDQAWMLMVLDAALRGENPYEVARFARVEKLGFDPEAPNDDDEDGYFEDTDE